MEKKGNPTGGNTGKPEQPIAPHHDRDYRQSVFDQTRADLAAARTQKTLTADPSKGYGIDSSDTPIAEKKNLLQRVAGSTAAKIGLIGTAVVTAGGVVIAPRLFNNEPQRIEIPSSFDPRAIDQWVGANNLVRISWGDYEKNPTPRWDEKTKTLTSALPIYFRDNREPELRITKSGYGVRGNNVITINGLQAGDVFFATDDGQVKFLKSGDFVGTFYFDPYSLSPKEQDGFVYITPGVKPLISLKNATPDGDYLDVDVKKGEPIAELLTSAQHTSFNGQAQITGISRDITQQSFNFAATPGASSEIKAIQITR